MIEPEVPGSTQEVIEGCPGNPVIDTMLLLDTDFIVSVDEAMIELHNAGWSIRHSAHEGLHLVRGHKGGLRIVGSGRSELDAWLAACDQANMQEKIWRERN